MAQTALRLGILASLFAMSLSGCLDEATQPLDDAKEMTGMDGHGHSHGMVNMDGLFDFTAKNCWEGGFQAIYGGQPKYADTWQTADVREEYGDGGAMPSYANVHNGFKCESATHDGETEKDFVFGYVGDPIKAPSFDPGGADWHVLLSFVSVQNGSFYDAFDASTTARISRATESKIQYLAGDRSLPEFATYIIFATYDNGQYESYSNMMKYRDVGPRTIRLWWTVPADGTDSHIGAHEHAEGETPPQDGTVWNPIYFDIHTQGGGQWATPKEGGAQVACHSGIDDHGPQGRLCQPTHSSMWEHKSLEFEMGHVIPDVQIKEYWFH